MLGNATTTPPTQKRQSMCSLEQAFLVSYYYSTLLNSVTKPKKASLVNKQKQTTPSVHPSLVRATAFQQNSLSSVQVIARAKRERERSNARTVLLLNPHRGTRPKKNIIRTKSEMVALYRCFTRCVAFCSPRRIVFYLIINANRSPKSSRGRHRLMDRQTDNSMPSAKKLIHQTGEIMLGFPGAHAKKLQIATQPAKNSSTTRIRPVRRPTDEWSDL